MADIGSETLRQHGIQSGCQIASIAALTAQIANSFEQNNPKDIEEKLADRFEKIDCKVEKNRKDIEQVKSDTRVLFVKYGSIVTGGLLLVQYGLPIIIKLIGVSK